MKVDETRFRAMGSDAHLIVVGGSDELLERAVARVRELELRWSRFLPDSEVSQLNEHAGSPVEVSADTLLLVELAIEAWRITGGSFDPTVLGALLQAGYSRSFDSLAGIGAPVASDLLIGCTDIVVDATTVTLPAGVGFDAGGIGKGLAADLIVGELLGFGAAGVCVNLGGDVRVEGLGPEGTWTIAVEHPHFAEPLALVGLHSGAVATSTTLKRMWSNAELGRHHLIDPSTGEPSDSDVVLSSVIAGQAWVAEVLAKAVLLRGSQRAFDLLDTRVINALTVDRLGVVRTTPNYREYTGGVEVAPSLAVI